LVFRDIDWLPDAIDLNGRKIEEFIDWPPVLFLDIMLPLLFLSSALLLIICLPLQALENCFDLCSQVFFLDFGVRPR